LDINNYSHIDTDNLNIENSFRNIYVHSKHAFYVLDGGWDTDDDRDGLEKLLRDLGGELLLLVQEQPNELMVTCISQTHRIRALEFLDYIFGSFGLLSGEERFAQGQLSKVLLNVHIKDEGISRPIEFFMARANEYFSESECIMAGTYVKENPDVLVNMTSYRKKSVPWAFVKTTDIAPEKTKISLRTLENDSGVDIISSEKKYIMIGCLGEVYDIQEEKFLKTYDKSEEKLDIFESFFNYIPAVEITDTSEYVAIDELAHLCYPKSDSGIYAKRLEKRTRVFRKGGVDYFVGSEGDYLVIRKDDYQDIYIVKEEIFYRTYEVDDER